MTEFLKYFTTTSKGGYSDCLNRDQGNVLPNCVGMCWALFYYFHGQRKDFSKRPHCDAKYIYEKCKANGSGFWVAKAVKENSILCFNIGEAGHVVYCFGQLANKKWLCAESNYSGTISNGKYIRWFVSDNPTVLYKNYQGCVYDFTK